MSGRTGRAAVTALTAATAVNASIAAYLGVLTLAAVAPARSRPARGTGRRFVIMVPAHDEAEVIGDTLGSFRALDYPTDRFEVHVVADNCTDATADIVRAHGYAAHERHDLANRGKGPALNWLFDRLDASTEFDVAVIVDADTVVDPGFLAAMDDAFADGARVAQGCYLVRDPGGSSSAAIRYAALACRHHLRPLGRNRLGASCGLYGNGMAFERGILRAHRWTGHLVEDAEFQMALLIDDGIRVRYVPEARVEAEMPDSLEAATSQNERWERGRVELVRRFVPVLLRRLPGARQRRVAVADAIADHVVPPISIVVVAQSAAVVASIAGLLISRDPARRREFARRAIVNAGTVGVLSTHVLAGLRTVAASPETIRGLAGAPQAVVWKVRLWARALRPKNEVAWRRTTRNQAR